MKRLTLKRATLFVAPILALAFTAATSQAQFYKIHNADVTMGGIGQFTNTLTSANPAIRQGPDNSFGGLVSFREHPVPWAGVEFNYSYTDTTEYFNAATSYSSIKTQFQEATAAYVFHPHFRKLQPFVNIGGGAIDFLPAIQGPNQWRSVGLVEVGFDIPTSNPHFGFRAQGRALIYRAPNFFSSQISSRSWVSTNEPSFGAYIRF